MYKSRLERLKILLCKYNKWKEEDKTDFVPLATVIEDLTKIVKGE
jgi:hypothetical protein